MPQGNGSIPEQDNKKDAFLKYLESEISYLDISVKRPGWTKWAIIGGIATIIWVIISQLASTNYLIKNILVIIVVISLIYNAFILILLISPKSYSYDSEKKFFLSKQILANSRVYYMLDIIRNLIVIFIISLLSNILTTLITICIYISNITFAVMQLSTLMCSYFAVPIPSYYSKPKYAKTINIINACLLLCTLYGVWGTVELIKVNLNNISIKDLQISLLISAAYCLLIMFTKSNVQYPLIDKLVDIRRSLIFEKISLNDAKKQAEIAINGLKVSEILQDIINAIISNMQIVSECMDNISNKLNVMIDLLNDSNIVNDQVGKIKTLEKEVEDELIKVDKLLDNSFKKSKKFIILSEMIIGADVNMKKDIDNISNQILNALSASREKTKNVKQKSKNYYDLNKKNVAHN